MRGNRVNLYDFQSIQVRDCENLSLKKIKKNFDIQKFRCWSATNQLKPVCTRLNQFVPAVLNFEWIELLFDTHTYTYTHAYIQNGNSNIFPKYGQSILTVSIRDLKIEFWQWIWSPHNNHSFLECVYMLVSSCIFPNRKKKLIFLIITPLLVLTIFTPSFIIRSN